MQGKIVWCGAVLVVARDVVRVAAWVTVLVAVLVAARAAVPVAARVAVLASLSCTISSTRKLDRL